MNKVAKIIQFSDYQREKPKILSNLVQINPKVIDFLEERKKRPAIVDNREEFISELARIARENGYGYTQYHAEEKHNFELKYDGEVLKSGLRFQLALHCADFFNSWVEVTNYSASRQTEGLVFKKGEKSRLVRIQDPSAEIFNSLYDFYSAKSKFPKFLCGGL